MVVPELIQNIITTLVYKEWVEQLMSHPDIGFHDNVLSGIAEGFQIGFDYKKGMFCSSAKSNMQSTLQCTLAVDEYLK